MSTGFEALDSAFDRIRRKSLAAGVIASVILLATAYWDLSEFFRAYLIGYLLWFGIALGSLAVLEMSHVVGGEWAFVSRRVLEAASGTLPWMLVLFAPIIVGMRELYPWSRPGVAAADPLIQAKAAYLNIPGFLVRLGIYFGCWLLMSHYLNRWSLEQDPSAAKKMRKLSAGGLVVYVLTGTFASVDWLVSLEPHWYSSIYGALFVTGQGLSALAFLLIVLSLLTDSQPLSDVLSQKQFHDLGNLVLAFVMLWAYMAFSQYLIIWSGNLQSEIPWYTRRTDGAWGWIALALLILHFAVPFLVLLSRQVKRAPQYLRIIAIWILVMRGVDYYWMVQPPFEPAAPRLHWQEFAAVIGLGGIWIAVFLRQLESRPLLPAQAPELEAEGV